MHIRGEHNLLDKDGAKIILTGGENNKRLLHIVIERNMALWVKNNTFLQIKEAGRIHIITGKTYGYFNNGVLPTPVRENYRFIGWYTNLSAGTKITANTGVEKNSARILYAHWEQLPPSQSIGRPVFDNNMHHYSPSPMVD